MSSSPPCPPDAERAAFGTFGSVGADDSVALNAVSATGSTYVGTVQSRQKLTIDVPPDGSQINSISAVVYCTVDASFAGDQVSGTLKIKSFVSGPAAACNTSDLKFTATRV